MDKIKTFEELVLEELPKLNICLAVTFPKDKKKNNYAKIEVRHNTYIITDDKKWGYILELKGREFIEREGGIFVKIHSPNETMAITKDLSKILKVIQTLKECDE